MMSLRRTAQTLPLSPTLQRGLSAIAELLVNFCCFSFLAFYTVVKIMIMSFLFVSIALEALGAMAPCSAEVHTA